MSATTPEILNTESDLILQRKQRLNSLKDRLEKYKNKSILISEKEKEEELALIEKERLVKADAERLDKEKNSLVQELQKLAAAEAAVKSTQLQEHVLLQEQLRQQLQIQAQQQSQPQIRKQQQQQMQMLTAFGYPTITEKDAINWLRNGL